MADYTGYAVFGPRQTLNGGFQANVTVGPYQWTFRISLLKGLENELGGSIGPFSFSDSGVTKIAARGLQGASCR